jgi:hypothetical protein
LDVLDEVEHRQEELTILGEDLGQLLGIDRGSTVGTFDKPSSVEASVAAPVCRT